MLLSCSSFFPIVNDSLLVCLCLVKFSLTSKHFISFSRAIQYFCLIFFDIVTTHKKEEGGRESMRMEEQERSKNIVNATSA